MSAAKRISALLLAALCALCLISCSESESAGEALIKPVEHGGTESESPSMRMAEAVYGSISRTMSAEVSISYAEKELVCESENARFAEYFVSAGDVVDEGTPIARFEIESSAAERQRLEAELEIAESEAERSEKSTKENVDAAQALLDAADASDARALRRAELGLERAKLEFEGTLEGAEARVEAARGALEDFDERSSDYVVCAPARGCVLSLASFAANAPVEWGSRICTFIDYGDIALAASSDIAGVPCYGAEATVSSNFLDAPLTSRILDAPLNRGEETGVFTVEIPEEVVEAANAALMSSGAPQFRPNIRVETLRFELDDVLTVPNTALSSENGKRFVYVMRDGSLRKRYVEAGLSDGTNTQILAGLEPGEYVSIG